MKLRSVWFSAILLLSWFGVYTQAAAQEKITRLPFTQKHIQDSLRTDWYGVYLKNRKIGYAKTTFAKAKDGDTPVYRSQTHLTIKTKSAGFPLHMSVHEVSEFDTRPPYRLRLMRSIHAQGKSFQDIFLRRDGNGYTATVMDNGRKTEKKLDKLDYRLADVITPYVWLLSRPEHGATIYVNTFDFDKLKTEKERLRMGQRKSSFVKGVKVTYCEVEVYVPYLKSTMLERFDSEGNLISGKIAGTFEMRLESEKDARNLDKSFDLFISGLAKIDRPIGKSRRVSRLVVELVGKNAKLVPNGPRQTVIRTEDGKYICKIGKKYSSSNKATEKEIKDCLEATTSYPAKNPSIVKLAKKAIGDAKTPRAKVKRLVKFVHKFIRPSYRVKGTVVLDLLEKKAGDCTAYAALFTTLARAAGIPAREVSGLAYLGDSEKAFGGHAWNEVVLDGVWHPVDASAGAFEVDAARIYLGSDVDGGVNLLENYGSLSLRLIDVKHKKKLKESTAGK